MDDKMIEGIGEIMLGDERTWKFNKTMTLCF
jgi:hypothetical protein